MSFEEKSTWVTLMAFLLAYSWYFLTMLTGIQESSVADLPYRGVMLGTVIGLVSIIVVSHVVIAAMAPDESDEVDERDREIKRRGEYVGGYVATAAALTGMGMAMYEIEHFWIANTILLVLVLSEIVSSLVKIYCYRRGF